MSKVRQFIFKFYELRKKLNSKLLIMAYKSLVECILMYSIIVRGGLFHILRNTELVTSISHKYNTRQISHDESYFTFFAKMETRDLLPKNK